MSEVVKTRVDFTGETAAKLLGILSGDNPVGKSLRPLFRRAFATGETDLETLGWMFEYIPKEIAGKAGYMSYEEKAIYLMLCIFAECRGKGISEISLFSAAAEADIPQRRLFELESVNSLEELRMPLCMLVKSIIAQRNSINYVELAKDLALFQYNKDRLIRKWARQYASQKYKTNKGDQL